MTAFAVVPVSPEIATAVRTSRRAPRYGHPVHQELAGGTGPCRECLSAFVVGKEERLLFTYSPFNDGARLPQPGPVFIHAAECKRFEDAGYPEGLRGIPVMAQAHHADGNVGAPVRLTSGDEATTLTQLLEESTVDFLHLRHAEAGCFIARVERRD